MLLFTCEALVLQWICIMWKRIPRNKKYLYSHLKIQLTYSVCLFLSCSSPFPSSSRFAHPHYSLPHTPLPSLSLSLSLLKHKMRISFLFTRGHKSGYWRHIGRCTDTGSQGVCRTGEEGTAVLFFCCATLELSWGSTFHCCQVLLRRR